MEDDPPRQEVKGHEKITVRLEPDAMEELRKRAGESTVGRAGGLALLIRRIVYEWLGWPMPTQFGDLGRSSRKRKPTGRPRGRPRKRPPDDETPHE